jgi:predicted acylesterase/phospholipase RssA
MRQIKLLLLIMDTRSSKTPAFQLPQNFQQLSIGLTLSGGGYRAAAFHLGTIAYLDRIGLLPQARLLSTVSGGTFTGAKYIISLVQKLPFREFFQEYYNALKNTNLVELGLQALKNGTLQVPSGRNTLIVAMAEVYAKEFFQDSNGNAYTFGIIQRAQLPVAGIIFNATEFRNGLPFRFQTSVNPQARFGNGKVYIPTTDAGSIRLADIVAASSCFPGGFEPIAFPDDFVWPHNKIPAGIQKAIYTSEADGPLALMDGGICDNQGITSLLLADEHNSHKLELVIISDVDEPQSDIFPYPNNDNSSENLTLNGLYLFIRFVVLNCILTVLAICYKLWQEFQQGTFLFWQSFFLLIFPLILVILVVLTLWRVRKIITVDILPRIPQVGIKAWTDIKGLTISQFLYLIELRLKSLLALTGSIFMGQIRRLIFKEIYDDKHYNNKIISNLIYDLMTGNKRTIFTNISRPSKALQEIIDKSVKMPTTLWFDQDDQLPNLISSGQATICFNLLRYVVRTYGQDTSKYPPMVLDFWNELLKDWQLLNDNPYVFHSELLSNA